MTERCLDAIPLLGPALDGELPESDFRWLSDHLGGCGGCRERQALISAQAAALRERLSERASQADFALFADGVMARIGAEQTRRWSPPIGERLSVWSRETFSAHRFAFGAGAGFAAAAAIAVVAALRPPLPLERPARPIALASMDTTANQAQIDALDVYGQEGIVLQFPGQTVIWVTEDAPRDRSAQ